MSQSSRPAATTSSRNPVALRIEATGHSVTGKIILLCLQLGALAWLASEIDWNLLSQKLVGALFLLILAAYIGSTLRTLMDVWKFGRVTLDLMQPLPAAGGMLSGRIRFRKPMPHGIRAHIKILCASTRFERKGSGKARSVEKTLWEAQDEFALTGHNLALTLAIPDGLPSTKQHGAPIIRWELQVHLDLPGVDFKRNYALPVTAAVAVSPARTAAVQDKQHEMPLDLAHSKPGTASALFLVMANLALLAGALYWNWQLRELVFIFWIENLIVGIFNIVRIAVCQPPQHQEAETSPKLFMIVFFAFHYGMFCFVHGLFLLSMFAEGESGNFDDISAIFAIVANNPELLQGVAALFISHLFSFFHNFIGRGEYRRTESGRLMMQPYGRIIVVHMFIIMGGIILNDFANPVLGLILFVGLKTLMDLGSHVVEHKLIQR
jgi:hypothetical protein